MKFIFLLIFIRILCFLISDSPEKIWLIPVQDSILFHPQYYYLEKLLSDSSYADNFELIKVNMERWKELPAYLGKNYLFINVADFRMDVVENDSSVMNMKVVVGRTYRKTPVFSSKITHLIFNPSWNIPPNILKKDILPMVLKDSSYLQKNHIRIFHRDTLGNRMEISSDTVDWNTLSTQKFPYELIQDPWKSNALGTIKFVLPNRYNIYLHDSPSKQLFEDPEPLFSSGCIRVSNAEELALYLLKDEIGWDENEISKIIESGNTLIVYLKEAVNVYIQYLTAWVDTNGKLQIRKDIYKRDGI